MEQSSPEGCRTFDSSLSALCAAGRIDDATALANADAKNDLRLRLERLRGGRANAGSSLRLASEREASGVHVAPALRRVAMR